MSEKTDWNWGLEDLIGAKWELERAVGRPAAALVVRRDQLAHLLKLKDGNSHVVRVGVDRWWALGVPVRVEDSLDKPFVFLADEADEVAGQEARGGENHQFRVVVGQVGVDHKVHELETDTVTVRISGDVMADGARREAGISIALTAPLLGTDWTALLQSVPAILDLLDARGLLSPVPRRSWGMSTPGGASE